MCQGVGEIVARSVELGGDLEIELSYRYLTHLPVLNPHFTATSGSAWGHQCLGLNGVLEV